MRNGKIYLAPNDSFEQFYLAVKGLINNNFNFHANSGMKEAVAKVIIRGRPYGGVAFYGTVLSTNIFRCYRVMSLDAA